MRTIVAYLLALAALGTGAVFGFTDWFHTTADTGGDNASSRPVPVIVAQVVRLAFADSIEALGTIRANESVSLSANRSDHIAALHFQDGQHVEAGDLLLELNSTEEHSMLREAKAILEERQAAYDRQRRLEEQEIAPESDVITAQAQLNAARARVASLEAAIADHEVRAPFSGQLGLRRVSVGAFLQPSTIITTLDDLSIVKVDFTIPESWLSSVSIGMPIKARTDAWPGQEFPGRVSAIDTRLDATTRSATIRAAMPNPDSRLYPGMLLRVVVDRGDEPVLQVPEDALVQTGSEHAVMVVDDGDIARRTVVEVGRRRVGRVEVLSGLEAGQRVVVGGLVRVRPDSAVEVVMERGGS